MSDLRARVAGLDLSRVLMVATIGSGGRFGPVDAFRLEANADAWTHLGLIRVMMVAQDQPGIPAELLDADASPLRVIQAGSLPEAIERLYEEHGARGEVRRYERRLCSRVDILGRLVQIEKHYHVPRLSTGVQRSGESLCTPEDLITQVPRRSDPTDPCVSRVLVLGSPGSGKTALCRYLAWRIATGSLAVPGRSVVPTVVSLRAWQAWATRRAGQGAELANYLEAYYRDPEKHLDPVPTGLEWRRWLEQGEVFLCLDGLDVAVGERAFRDTLATTLEAVAACPVILTCRTGSFQRDERLQRLATGLRVVELTALDKTQREALIRTFPPEARRHFDAAGVNSQLDRLPQLDPLAGNPRLLGIVCLVVEREGTLPATRSEIYGRAVDELLKQHRVAITYPARSHGLPPTRKGRILEWAALELLVRASASGEGTVGHDLMLGALIAGARNVTYTHDLPEMAGPLLEDLLKNSGLIEGSRDEGYAFLHGTLQEFLAAAALARVANNSTNRWNTIVEVADRSVRLWDLVHGMLRKPRWQDVIALLREQLREPSTLPQ